MSRETSEWLNTMTLIGDTDNRGNAWHYRAASQGEESNHYPGAVPMEDVQRRLFAWEPVSVPVFVKVPCTEDEFYLAREAGDATATETVLADPDDPASGTVRVYYRFIERQGRQNITASDDLDVDFGMFRPGYTIHGYNEWLLENVSNLVDGEVHISSAGLLKNRAQAWVELSLSESQSVAGLEFRPHLLACTSLDGTIATTYKRAVQATVCDNTLDVARGERGQTVKVKHSKYSRLKIAQARDALAAIVATGDAFAEEVQRLCEMEITDRQFSAVLDEMIPTSELEPGMALTKAEAKRETIAGMYRSDERCAPWTGTAFGIVQTFNTWNHHEKPTRGETIRAERNMQDALNGNTTSANAEVLSVIDKVLATV